jgi:hypothetical protein
MKRNQQQTKHGRAITRYARSAEQLNDGTYYAMSQDGIMRYLLGEFQAWVQYVPKDCTFVQQPRPAGATTKGEK